MLTNDRKNIERKNNQASMVPVFPGIDIADLFLFLGNWWSDLNYMYTIDKAYIHAPASKIIC